MCRYVAILVYQGLIEDVSLFDKKNEATTWLGGLVEAYEADKCADSIIWDTQDKSPISLGFVH